MAILKGKQISTRLSGSYIISGSTQSFIGTSQFSGSVETSGSLTLRGASVDLNLRADDNTTIAKLLTTSAGNSQLILYDNDNFSAQSTINLNSSNTDAFQINSGSLNVLNFDRDNVKLFVAGDISGSSASTGSFGHLQVFGNVTASGVVKADAFESSAGGDTISFGDNLSVTGHITASGNINTTAGRVFEQGTSVIDHATAMAIVFGG